MIKSAIKLNANPTPEYPKIVVSGLIGTIALQTSVDTGFVIGHKTGKECSIGSKIIRMDGSNATWEPYHGTVELTNV